MIKTTTLKPLSKAKFVMLSKDFREDYLDFKQFDTLIDQSTTVLKLIFHIISDLRMNVHQKGHFRGVENQTRLELWNQEFCGSERNVIVLNYNVKTFFKNRDKKAMKKSLKFLKDFKNEEYYFLNNDGLKVSTSGGLITEWYFAEKSGNFEIILSTYWANKIVSLGIYNEFMMELLDMFSEVKQYFFVMWLLELIDGRGHALYQTLQTTYKVNYKNRYEFIRSWLLPIKTKLDSKSQGISFNYSIDDKNPDLINFIVYPLKPIIDGTMEVDKRMVSYKMVYINRIYKLSAEDAKKLKIYLSLNYHQFNIDYKKFIVDCRKEKIKASDIKGAAFIKRLIPN